MDIIRRNQELKLQCSENLSRSLNLIDKIRTNFLVRGCGTIKSLGKRFHIMDTSGDGKLDLDEFKHGCMGWGNTNEIVNGDKPPLRYMELSEKDLTDLFIMFDADASRKIDYKEFLRAVRPKMNVKRKELVLIAFYKLLGPRASTDPNAKSRRDMVELWKMEAGLIPELRKQSEKLWELRSRREKQAHAQDQDVVRRMQQQQQQAAPISREDQAEEEALVKIIKQMEQHLSLVDDTIAKFPAITAQDLLGRYDYSKHPKYMNGEMSKTQVLEQFLKSFEMDKHVDGEVTLMEFLNYYSGISASIPDDSYFDLMMRTCWKLETQDLK